MTTLVQSSQRVAHSTSWRNSPVLTVAVLVLLAGFSFYFQIGSTPLFDWDEGAFSEATREMLAGGDYLTTYLNGEYRSAKPILIYWLQAGAAHVFGLNEFAMRLPSAICATLWTLLVFLFLRRVADSSTALAGGIAMIGALQISIIGRAAISDALLNLCITGAMLSIFLHDADRDDDAHPLFGGRNRKQTLWGLSTFVAMGFGTLTKGPIALIIPGVVSLAYFLLRRRWRAYFQLWLNPGGIALFALITLPWFVLQYAAQGQAFIDGFFLKHNVGRFAQAMEGHGGPLWYYLPVIILGMLPFSALLIRPARVLRSALNDELRTFAWLWFWFVFVFFSISGTKLPHYVIYGYTGLFVLMALDHEQIRYPVAYIPPFVFAALCLFLPEILAVAQTSVHDKYSQAMLTGALKEFDLTYRVAADVATATFAGLALWPRTNAGNNYIFNDARIRMLIAAVALLGLLNFALVPVASRTLQSPVREAAEVIAREKPGPVVFWKFYWPSFLFYHRELVPVRLPRPGETVLLKTYELKYFKTYDLLYEKNGIALARVTSMDRDHYLRMMLE